MLWIWTQDNRVGRSIPKAFDLLSGKPIWKTAELGPRQGALYASDGVVLATTPIWHGMRATHEGPGATAFNASNGQTLWTRKQAGSLPAIVNGVVYFPQAFDLHSGKHVLRQDPLTGHTTPFSASVTGGCAQLAGCENILMRRSGSLGFFDLEDRSSVYHFPNMRASCWINMIPACGLVLVPEGSSSCPCAYNYKASVALMPAERHNHWGLYTPSPRPKTARIKQLQLNFGAPVTSRMTVPPISGSPIPGRPLRARVAPVAWARYLTIPCPVSHPNRQDPSPPYTIIPTG